MHTDSDRLIDLSHTVYHGLTTYPGLPAVVISDYLSREASQELYSPGTSFHIGKIEMVANTGTYLDAPFHRFSQGKDLSELPLAWVADLPGRVIRVGPERGGAIRAEVFQGVDLTDRAVLIHTGWSTHWGTDRYGHGHPYLTEDAARHLRSSGALLVGIDSLNIDDTGDGRRPAHTLLLESEIPIVEHMTNLESLPEQGFRFFAVPVKVREMGSFPVRAFALIES